MPSLDNGKDFSLPLSQKGYESINGYKNTNTKGVTMKRKMRPCLKNTPIFVLILIILALGTANGIFATRAGADDATEARQLTERAKLTLETFMQAPETEGFRSLVKTAKGVFIAPQVLRGAFVFGVSGGSGIFLARDSKSGGWAGPVFYTVGGVSFGFQIGGEASEVIFLAMTDRGVNALLKDSVRLGADVGVAVGPIGAGVDASTANLSVDILTFSRSKGLYGGVSLAGSVVYVRDDRNNAYYGLNTTPTDILIAKVVMNKHALGLLDMLSAASRPN
jgi:SH3 domain-containing YSC84-like protein 1